MPHTSRGKATRARARTRTRTQSHPEDTILDTIPNIIRIRVSCHTPFSMTLIDDLAPDIGLLSSPYIFANPDNASLAALQASHPDTFELALSTTQCVWVRLDSRARYRGWSKANSEITEIEKTAQAELEARIHAWNAVNENQDEQVSQTARSVYLNWGAKRIVWLAEELDIRRKGTDTYTNAQRLQQLPTQFLWHDAGLEHAQNLQEGSGSEEERDEDGHDLFDEQYD